ncbi:MAG: hypothetical protein K8R17_13190 [Methanosarcinales archaeon]|nr:hypothetical protein [Methanosarcinales archaeon]
MMKGKIVLVPFPFDDLSTTKVRPAVCLTYPISPHRHVIMAFISSWMPVDQLETDLILPKVQVGMSSKKKNSNYSAIQIMATDNESTFCSFL